MTEPPEALLSLAERCESAGRPDRELDADIYEAIGFAVRRRPAKMVSRRSPAGGIYQDGSAWKALGTVSADIDAGLSLLRQAAPNWLWSLRAVTEGNGIQFEAVVADCAGNGAMASLALCAALLRAIAHHGLRLPDTPFTKT